MFCTKYTITNGCGHRGNVRFIYCGGRHENHEIENELCHRMATPKTGGVEITVAMGSEFCNSFCRAFTMGWKCCTCGYVDVEGTFHSATGLLIHVTKGGRFHAFCDTCGDHDPSTDTHVCKSRNTKTHENRHPTTIPSRSSTGSTAGSGSATLYTPTTPTKATVTWADPEPPPLKIMKTNTDTTPTMPRKSSRRTISDETRPRTKTRGWFSPRG